MKYILFWATALLGSHALYAQQSACTASGGTWTCNPVYQYDAAGNRTARIQFCTCIMPQGRHSNTPVAAATNDLSTITTTATPLAITKIFPNPTTNTVQIYLSTNAENASLQIIDNTGKRIAEQTINGSEAAFDFSTYPEGIYTIVLQTPNNIQTQRVVKVKE